METVCRPQEYTRTSTRASALVRESTANSYVSSCERNARSIATVCTMCRTARPPGGLLCDHGLWHRLHLPPRGTRVCISLGCRSAERAELQLERRRRCKRQLEHRAERRAVLGNHLPAQSRRRCGRGGPSPGADVAGGAPSPGADVAAKSPVLAQMWTGGGPSVITDGAAGGGTTRAASSRVGTEYAPAVNPTVPSVRALWHGGEPDLRRNGGWTRFNRYYRYYRAVPVSTSALR